MYNALSLKQCGVVVDENKKSFQMHGHAKIILFGEHAVVYGRHAIAAAIKQGSYASAQLSTKPSCLHIRSWDRIVDCNEESELGFAFRALLQACQVGEQNIHIDVDVDVPGGFGLGCSASMGVAITRAIYSVFDRPLDYETTLACALVWERVFHGSPSGIDVTAATLGTSFIFQRNKPIQPLTLLEPLELAIVSTGHSSSTKKMVEDVARQHAQTPQMVECIFDDIDTLSLKAVDALQAGRWTEIGTLMDLNHALLSSLMLSTETLEQACHIARNAGALGAKLTGAGGGGCAIALAPGCSQTVVEAWRSVGLYGFTTKISI